MEREIHIDIGTDFDDVVKMLMEADKRGERVFVRWYKYKIHSKGITEDKAYETAFGLNKADYLAYRKRVRAALEQEKKEREAKALANASEWIEEGKALIYPEREEAWIECVNNRVADLYNGAEVQAALEIMKSLDEGASIDEVKKTFKEQGHSGASAALARSIILHFSKRGPEFYDATGAGLSDKDKELVEKIIKENEEFEKEQSKAK